MRGNPINSFKGSHYSGEIILLVVRWYLRCPLAYQHVAEIIPEVWQWMRAAAGIGYRRMCRRQFKEQDGLVPIF